MSPTDSPYVVTVAGADCPLRQSELLSNVVYGRQRLESIGTGNPVVDQIVIERALVISQDCDLDQDHRVRFPPSDKPSDKLIPSVLLSQVFTAESLFGDIKSRYGGSNAWKRVQQNNDPRFHYLQAVTPGCDRLNDGIPELVIDFKRYFAIPTDELYFRIESGETLRRCVLLSPYLEHLSCRFAHYLGRVGLPTDHVSA